MVFSCSSLLYSCSLNKIPRTTDCQDQQLLKPQSVLSTFTRHTPTIMQYKKSLASAAIVATAMSAAVPAEPWTTLTPSATYNGGVTDYASTFGIAVIAAPAQASTTEKAKRDNKDDKKTTTKAKETKTKTKAKETKKTTTKDGKKDNNKDVTQIADGQVQATKAAAAPVSQIGDGQIQAATKAAVSQIGDGQVQATKAAVSQIGDGQVQATKAAVSQIGDGQVQATKAAVSQIGDGQVQATKAAVSQIGDGQVQATKAAVSQIGDGQVQAATKAAVSQIGDGQVQAATKTAASQIGDGQVQATATGAQQVADGQVQAKSPAGVLANTCNSDSTLKMTLKKGELVDSKGRIGSIVANRQFQFDGPPPQAGAIYAAGWSITPAGNLALGDQDVFYQCLSGDFYNLYDKHIGSVCNPVYLQALNVVNC
ncbi:uncharacterized protein KNAG_0C01100 [Huiozyma naganishii CBS 8797]|uniref:Cell wall mannoprotein PIR1-like C-terminal domain-containing protein n=1 Tax=Huiozyma naganishii (strain ATCC MYA-139 / BCRC 22969 / CBS 8797 / KCTC 17520 / NBRC 10181 / NCYC 3082 / Yp74L-3) TaxID=1071383 RepID=J7RI58_HUIN7|nr:hypothetical protein KNAG_0C01100 [Kazachstania naganishii CBS 8797]CCK69223.1 hypothetical protein KNAG_0C01100 [Kazachstania naganishii CBS 8797]